MSTPREDHIAQLKRDGRLDDALCLCEQWVTETEGTAHEGGTVESWPYLQACVILRKLKRPADEVAVIERFVQQPSSGSKQAREIVERLTKAYSLAGLTETRSVDGESVVFYAPENVPVDARSVFVREALIIDCETTGLSNSDELIELAILRFSYSLLSGRILRVIGSYCGLQEPSCPISPAATKVNGLSLHHVVGQRIDLNQVMRLIDGVDLIIAHNASFDRRMVTKLLPALADAPWYCSQRGVAWMDKGCPSTKLQEIAAYYGTALSHRALPDAQAVLDLLSKMDAQTGKTILHELLCGEPLDYVSRWESNSTQQDSMSVTITFASAPAKDLRGSQTSKATNRPWWKIW